MILALESCLNENARPLFEFHSGFSNLLDFNKTYFTEVKISELTEIPLGVKKADIVTLHPSDSYELIGENPIEKIVIKDAVKFWETSKYLVVVVK